MKAEPKVKCRYATLPSSVALADVATLMAAMPAGDTMQVVTELLEVVEALRAWCAEAGVAIVDEDESRVLTTDGCNTE